MKFKRYVEKAREELVFALKFAKEVPANKLSSTLGTLSGVISSLDRVLVSLNDKIVEDPQKRHVRKMLGQMFSPLTQEEKDKQFKLMSEAMKKITHLSPRDGSGKRQKYLLSQSIEQLEEMQILLNDAKQAELKGLIDKLEIVRQDYDKPSSMRNKFSIRSKVGRNAKKIRNGFSPKVLFPPQE